MKKYIFISLIGISTLAVAIFFVAIMRGKKTVPSVNKYSGTLEETGKMKESKSQQWWLNSGGIMNIDTDSFSTNLGKLQRISKWRKLYAKNNPTDTDNGYRPQNIFRLVTREKFEDFSQSVYFYIDAINLSDSQNRNESNGVLLFNRYQDGDNLYYVGLRVDGHGVIKKKIDDTYYTMIEKPVIRNGKKYDRDENPNMLPLEKWVGIKSEVINNDDSVHIKLYVDLDQSGEWKLVMETEDDGDSFGDASFTKEGYAGIRTDFMDVEFKKYHIAEL